MKLILFFILLFVCANCLPMKLLINILTELKQSTNGIQTSVAKNMKFINDLHNQSSSNSMRFESKLDEILNKLEKTEQRIDQKFTSISEDPKNSTLNMKKLQDSLDQLSVNHNDTSSTVDQLSASVAEIKKYLKEEQNETLSYIKMLEKKLNDSQEKVKILDQKIGSNSEDHQKSGHQVKTTLKVNSADCLDLYNLGKNVSNSYFLATYNNEVLCDKKTDGGGWLVIQQRKKVTKQVDFQRDWDSYKEGFGDLDTEFWIGNEFLHRITNQKSYELRIEMEDFQKGHFYATYSEFRVGNEESGYQLHVGGYEGNVTDQLDYHNNMKFSTLDRDNDELSDGNCAEFHSVGFWYKSCYYANLNGVYPTVRDRSNYSKLIHWYHNDEWLVLINVEMKIRPKQ